jgi:hypothetical protein
MNGSTIIIIIFILCVLPFVAYLGIRMIKRSSDTEQRVGLFSSTPGVHFFRECNYGGDPIQQPVPETKEDYGVLDGMFNFKSFIITSGVKIDTYSEKNETGVKISYTGPKKVACLETPINSIRITKV